MRAGHAQRRLDLVEDRPVDAFGVVAGLEQERRDRSMSTAFCNTCGAVAAEVTGHFAGAHREADQHDIVEVEVLEQGMEVCGERVVS